MSKSKFANPTVVINNIAVPVVPNSFTYTKGFVEQELKVQSVNDSVQTVFSKEE